MWGNSFVDIGMGLPCTMVVSHGGKWISYVELTSFYDFKRKLCFLIAEKNAGYT